MLAGWPEVGSRMMTLVIMGQDLRGGWVIVQDGRLPVRRGTIQRKSWSGRFCSNTWRPRSVGTIARDAKPSAKCTEIHISFDICVARVYHAGHGVWCRWLIRFEAYCREKGYKKSPLIARLVLEYLDREGFNPQPDLFNRDQGESK